MNIEEITKLLNDALGVDVKPPADDEPTAVYTLPDIKGLIAGGLAKSPFFGDVFVLATHPDDDNKELVIFKDGSAIQLHVTAITDPNVVEELARRGVEKVKNG